MNQDDRSAIDQLFEKLREVERRSTPRDPDAEAMIRQRVAQQPGAPYYMAQTIVVQEQALETARRQIEALQQQANPPGLFGGLFGGGQRTRQPVRSVPNYQQNYGAGGGGGFLAGAAQTALGVAGGVLIANMITGAFAGDSAEAAEADADGGDFGDAGDGGDFGGDGGDF